MIGAVVAWLATHEDERPPRNGGTVFAQDFCDTRGLLPGWPGPKHRPPGTRPDPAGAMQAAFDTKHAPTAQ